MPDVTESGIRVTYADDGRPTNLSALRSRIEVRVGPDAGAKGEFTSEHIRIGASERCDFVLKDKRVSRLHLEISMEPGGILLRDLESTNGTFVGGYRVREIFIWNKTTINIGATQLVFEALDDAFEVPLSEADRFGDLVGTNVSMRAMFAQLERIAVTDATVLLTGETGTGKELAADAIHRASPRRDKPFVVFDCGAVSRNLFESELFGHEKGAFTGAHRLHRGAFERADGGTLFLDEIGELPPELQPKLLRATEQKEIHRLGSSETIPVDVRIIAATRRDLAAEVNQGQFREDLYYRLAVVRVRMPPLRERRDDIPLLIENILATLPGDHSAVTGEVIESMKRHTWPGNVRELRNAVERLLLSASTGWQDDKMGDPERPPHEVDVSIPYKIAKASLIEDFEKRYVEALLAEHGGNISAAARAAGIERVTIYKMLQRHGLKD